MKKIEGFIKPDWGTKNEAEMFKFVEMLILNHNQMVDEVSQLDSLVKQLLKKE